MKCASRTCTNPADLRLRIGGGPIRDYCLDCRGDAERRGLSIELVPDLPVEPPKPLPAPPAPTVKRRPRATLPAAPPPPRVKRARGRVPQLLPQVVSVVDVDRCCFDPACPRPPRSRGMCKVHYNLCLVRGEWPEGTPASREKQPRGDLPDRRQAERDAALAASVRELWTRLHARAPGLALGLLLEFQEQATADLPRLYVGDRATLGA